MPLGASSADDEAIALLVERLYGRGRTVVGIAGGVETVEPSAKSREDCARFPRCPRASACPRRDTSSRR